MTERIRQNVIIPQVNEPLGLVDGKPVFPTTAWHQYFDGLWKRSGGFSDGLLEEIIRSFVETSENRAAIEAVTGLVRSLEALSQSNAEDARQAIESAVEAARQARDVARAEAQAELAVALEDAFTRLRRVEDNLRAEVEATLASLGELARINQVALGNLGPDVFRTQTSGTFGSAIVVNNEPLDPGKALRRIRLPSVQKANQFTAIESFIELSGSDLGTYLLEIGVVPITEAAIDPGDPFTGFGALDGAPIFSQTINVSVANVVTPNTNQLSVIVNNLNFAVLNASRVAPEAGYNIVLPSDVWLYLYASRTGGNPGSSLTVGTDTEIRITNTLNKQVT